VPGECRSTNSLAIGEYAGIGRSGLVGACVLGQLRMAPDSAFAMLSRARGLAVPDTEAQAEWVGEFMRGRTGTVRR